MSSYTKDPDAILDYAYDWTAWLADAETISTHTIIPAAGIAVDSSAESAGVVTVWLSGGTAGQRYQITCRIVTSQGRTDDRTITITMRER